MFMGFLFSLHYLFFVWRDLVCGSSWRSSWLWLTLSIKPVEGVLVHGSEVASGACWELLRLVAALGGLLQGSACSMNWRCPGIPSQGLQLWGADQASSILAAAVSWTARNNLSALKPHQKKPLSCSDWWWESCCMCHRGGILMLASKVWESLKA